MSEAQCYQEKISPAESSLDNGDYDCLWDLEEALEILSVHCDHAEHKEQNTLNDVSVAASQLRQIAARLATRHGVTLNAVYADRLRQMETSSPLNVLTAYCTSMHCAGNPSSWGTETIVAAQTWYELQVGQKIHDNHFHADVYNLSKYEQLRHYTLHAAKLPSRLSKALRTNDMEEFCRQRLPDILALGVMLATLCGEELPKTPISAAADDPSNPQA